VREIPTADWSWINTAADRFERAWMHGDQPRIEDYLSDVGHDRVPAILDELLRVECELRRLAGEEPDSEEYRGRFPDYRGVVDRVFRPNGREGDAPESDDLPAQRGRSTTLKDQSSESRSFRSTALEGASPDGRGDSEPTSPGQVPGPRPTPVAIGELSTSPTVSEITSAATEPDGGPNAFPRPGPGMPGWRVGHYMLVERLGGGSQGNVWRAVQLEPIVRTVAFKLLPPGIAPSDDRVKRLAKEAERGGGLSHEAILPIYEFGCCDGYTYLTMQLVDGFPLNSLLARRRAFLAGSAPADLHRLAVLPEPEYIREVVRLLTRVARALEHAHARRIVHRDVKPSNILIERTDHERVFLSDFGLARNLDDLTASQSASWVGTVTYMPPEKLLGFPDVDEKRGDVFALGVTLFEAVTLARPVELPENLTMVAAAARLATSEPRPPRSLDPRVSRDLEAVIQKAIDRNPALRYPKVSELADDLDRFLRGEPVHARPLGRTRKVFRAAARHRTALSVVGVALLLAATAWLVRWGINLENAYRAASYRRLADDHRRTGRFEDADESLAKAEVLVPGAPQTAGLRELLQIERREEFYDEIDRGDVVRAWRDWNRYRPLSEPDRVVFDRLVGLQTVRAISEFPRTRVTLHALRSDGHPKQGSPLYELEIAPLAFPPAGLNQTLEADVKVIPGNYWITASVDELGAFVERPLEVKRYVQVIDQIQLLRLFPKTVAQASTGMVLVTGGTLKMGSNETLSGNGPRRSAPPEYPEHEVSLPGFYLDSQEVTNRAFWEFLEQTGREDWGAKIWPNSGGRPEAAHLDWPVTRVAYHEAVEFAAWRGCCLPEEAQLEWAGRGSSGLKMPVNATADVPADHWTQLHPVGSDPLDQTSIGSKTIFDLFGNAGELTLFRYREYPHPARPLTASTARLGFVVRSGGFRDSLTAKLVSLGYLKRASLIPEARDDHVGFRCARSINPRISPLPRHLDQE
jgi:serine/threonine protein kinase/formylglycine-generating enzyme required for sulfatase activity